MKEALRIALVEDDKNAQRELLGFFDKYKEEYKQPFAVSVFDTATAFSVSENSYDIIFMDIMLPDGNGMDIVRKLRENKINTPVIFVTNMVQYAIKGYEVHAFDFIVKPVNYYNFKLKLTEAVNYIDRCREKQIWINTKNSKRKLDVSKIIYVDIINHYVTYHTTEGEFSSFGSLLDVQSKLGGRNFILCNRCYLVNLDYVKSVTANSVLVGDTELQISRQKRAEFMKALNEYVAEGGFV